MTYNDILSEMASAYFEQVGSAAEDNSFEEKIIEALASELYSDYCRANYVYKQMYVQTASGENLDKLGEMRSCTRKTATKACGTLKFYNESALDEDTEISAGTVCSVKDKPYIQFETLEDAVIKSGETAIEVSAEALDSGEEYNVSAGEITVMVNAPVTVESVVNESAFYGGCNDETDSSYRRRILDNYTVPSNGMGRISIENKINALDYVKDSKVLDCVTAGEVSAAVILTDDDGLTNDRIQDMRECIGFVDIAGLSVNFHLATAVLLSVKCDIHIESGANGDSIQSEAEEIIKDILGEEKIGKSISLSALMKPLLAVDGVDEVEIYCSDILSTEFYCPPGEYLKLNDLELNIYE